MSDIKTCLGDFVVRIFFKEFAVGGKFGFFSKKPALKAQQATIAFKRENNCKE